MGCGRRTARHDLRVPRRSAPRTPPPAPHGHGMRGSDGHEIRRGWPMTFRDSSGLVMAQTCWWRSEDEDIEPWYSDCDDRSVAGWIAAHARSGSTAAQAVTTAQNRGGLGRTAFVTRGNCDTRTSIDRHLRVTPIKRCAYPSRWTRARRDPTSRGRSDEQGSPRVARLIASAWHPLAVLANGGVPMPRRPVLIDVM